MEMHPYVIAVSDEVLNDLSDRLRRTRWPERELVEDWSQGIPLSYVKELCDYWANSYDWRAREAALNRFDHFTSSIDDCEIHYIHQRSPHEDAVPLLLSHGWPGSIVEFHKVIEPLTNPTAFGGQAEDAFHVICPSLPGYGLSGKPPESGWGVEKIADVFTELVTGLGYDRFGAQGGDWGSAITTAIGGRHPKHCIGIHLNMVMRGKRPKDREPNEAEQPPPPMKPPRIVTPFFGRKDVVRGPPGAAGRYTPSAAQISSPATAAVMASWRPSAPWNASDQELPSPAPVERFASTKCVVCAPAVAARPHAVSSARGKVRRIGAVMVGELGGKEGAGLLLCSL